MLGAAHCSKLAQQNDHALRLRGEKSSSILSCSWAFVFNMSGSHPSMNAIAAMRIALAFLPAVWIVHAVPWRFAPAESCCNESQPYSPEH